jgi:transcriptional/translational regulatory protein YebC/TACO1
MPKENVERAIKTTDKDTQLIIKVLFEGYALMGLPFN